METQRNPLLTAILMGSLSIALGMSLSGCDDDKDNPIEANNNAGYEGIWHAQGYGQLAEVTANSLTLYQLSENYCLLTEQAFGSATDLAEDGWVLSADKTRLQQNEGPEELAFTSPVYSKLDTLPEQCGEEQLIDLIHDDIEAGYPADFARDFDLFYETFAEFYPSFDKRGVDWAARRTLIETELGQPDSEEALSNAMALMIQPLYDSHVSVISDSIGEYSLTHPEGLDNRLLQEYIDANGDITNDEEYQAALSYQAEQMELIENLRAQYADGEIQFASNDQLAWYQADVDGNQLGYLLINQMHSFYASADIESMDEEAITADLAALEAGLEQALEDLADTQGLIIDVRTNPGGYDAASQLIARYFLDSERTLYSKQARLGNDRTEAIEIQLTPVDSPWLKPVVLLTSRLTTSAAEVFTLMMAELPHVTLVGEPTQGAISDVLEKTLPSGIEFNLVNEYYLTPAGDWYEVSGIPVDVEVEFGSQSDRDNEEDSGIETAAAILLD